MKEAENQYGILDRHIKDIIYYFDFESGCYTYFNRQGKKFFGLKLKDLPVQGEKILSKVHPEDNIILKKELQSIIKDGLENKSIEYRFKGTDNAYVWFSDVWNIVKVEGKIVGYEGILRDITDKKNNELLLKKKFNFSKDINEMLLDAVKNDDLMVFLGAVVKRLCLVTDVSRTYIFKNEETLTSNIVEWCKEGIEPQIDNLKNLPKSAFPYWFSELQKDNVIKARSVEKDLPKELHDVLEAQDIKSLIVVPLWVDEKLWGFMGFDECMRSKEWVDSEIEILRTAANIISLVIKYKNEN